MKNNALACKCKALIVYKYTIEVVEGYKRPSEYECKLAHLLITYSELETISFHIFVIFIFFKSFEKIHTKNIKYLILI